MSSDRSGLGEAYRTLAKAANFKVGDKVKLLRKADYFELGWPNIWASSANDYIGQIGEIINISSNGNIKVSFSSESTIDYHYPFFVLELVEPVSEKHTITIDGKSTEVSEEAYNEIKRLFN
jgi:hypothetical protein